MNFRKVLSTKGHNPAFGLREVFKYFGPGLLVTVGFIDPGNWASNIAAGSEYGYKLLWMVTLSTIMLIILQHNVAHLGIVTGECLAESANHYLKPWLSKVILSTGIVAAVSTAMAEILGGAIALNMLFKMPIRIGAVLILIVILWLLYTNTYSKLESWSNALPNCRKFCCNRFCNCIIICWYFFHNDRWDGWRYHICRNIRRTL